MRLPLPIVFGVILSIMSGCDPPAKTDYRKELEQEGWVRVTAQELNQQTDFTMYGAAWFAYVDSKGTGVRMIDLRGRRHHHIGNRKITPNGEVITQFEDATHRGQRIYSVWKRKGKYQFILPNGHLGPWYTIKPGNPENL